MRDFLLIIGICVVSALAFWAWLQYFKHGAHVTQNLQPEPMSEIADGVWVPTKDVHGMLPPVNWNTGSGSPPTQADKDRKVGITTTTTTQTFGAGMTIVA